ncbi:hypothetical protein [Streptomyces olivochromogenes]|uniref:Uncharacterized protein n=1 Tax=Streptomyces olivochromogenes TaxID=1963 RepID=A0A286PG60_STROL|nr:hypothetical protein [Streptomyces olivochromogenes]GAX58539.1 hypothetical protein SO3561_10112 [Streptomyces olivochromogenes]
MGAAFDEWAFEVEGEPVASYQEFQQRLDLAASIHEGEFAARTNGIVVRSV